MTDACWMPQGLAAATGETVSAAKGRSRLAQVASATESEESASVSESAESGNGSGEENESPSKGPKRKNIRKVKSLTSVMLKAAAEGRNRDTKRKEAIEKAAAEVGKALVLKVPAEKGRKEVEVIAPEHMSEQLQPHQRVGVCFLWECCVCKSKGAILAQLARPQTYLNHPGPQLPVQCRPRQRAIVLAANVR